MTFALLGEDDRQISMILSFCVRASIMVLSLAYDPADQTGTADRLFLPSCIFIDCIKKTVHCKADQQSTGEKPDNARYINK